MPDSKDKKTTQPDYNEIASTGRGGLFLGGYLNEIARPSDPILQSLGGNLKQYETLKRDDQVHTTFQQRRRAVTACDWGVEPGGEAPVDIEAADFLKEQLGNIDWDDKTEKMLWGVFYGYAVSECLWAKEGNRVVLKDIKVRDRSRFRFGRDGSLRLKQQGLNNDLIMPDRKFWCFSTGADHDDEPYGIGLAHALYWPVWLKRNGVTFWSVVLEKFGGPTTIGKYPAGADEGDRDKLLAAVIAAASETGVVIPEGMIIEFLEAQRQSGGDHHKFVAYWDSAIAKVVLSQTMTTDSGSSLSQAQVHMEVRQDVVASDADLACGSFNDGPAKWLTEWNFPTAQPPKVWRLTKEPEDLVSAADKDKTLSEIGYRPTPERIEDTYGPGYEFIKAGASTPPVDTGGPEFADDTGDAFERLIDELASSGHLTATMEPLNQALDAAFAEAVDFDDLKGRLDKVLTKDISGRAAEQLAEALFAGRLGGETGADVD